VKGTAGDFTSLASVVAWMMAPEGALGQRPHYHTLVALCGGIRHVGMPLHGPAALAFVERRATSTCRSKAAGDLVLCALCDVSQVGHTHQRPTLHREQSITLREVYTTRCW
jgi:hypothetical protein